MLAIRLTAEPERLDVIALPVRSVADSSAEPVPAGVALPDGVAEEAAALVPLARLTGRAGETRMQLRPGRTPERLLLLGVGEGDEAGWRAAGRRWPGQPNVRHMSPSPCPPGCPVRPCAGWSRACSSARTGSG